MFTATPLYSTLDQVSERNFFRSTDKSARFIHLRRDEAILKRTSSASQEVRNDLADRDGTRAVLSGVEDFEVPLQVVVDVEDRGNITATVAVVGCRPNRNQVGIFEPVLEAVHNQLMGAGHELEIVDMVILGSNLGAKKPASTSRRDSPRVDVLGVRPHQITEGSFVWHFHSAVN